jgi:hypothetical protein
MDSDITSANGLVLSGRSLLAAALFALTAPLSHGGYIPLTFAAVDVAATPGATGTFVIGGGTVGWSFTAGANMTVTELGYYDLNGDGLGESHPVGVWDSMGVLMGSATVTTNDPLIDSFRYTQTTPFQLQLGQTYVIGAYHTENVDNYLSSYGLKPLASYTTAPAVIYEGSRISFGPSFVEPTITGEVVGRFGPNFQFYTTPIPEPATALFGLALVGFCATARRRIRATA